MKYIIVANGTIKKDDYFRKMLNKADMIVCADGGAKHLERMEIIPDIVIGDLDSMDQYAEIFVKKNRVRIIKHPPKKNASDTELAALWAIENQASDITIIGATGTRLDHSLANIFLMRKIALTGISCRIIDDNNEIYLVSESLTLKGSPGDLLSIIPVTEKVTGLTVKGVEYPLLNAEISMGSSLGISNCFTESQAVITIKTGVLIVTKSKD
ncbi:MAG: thiamine diphosphokinase [Thermodesulfobacteriota bacterium]|nr:thiamine diphosphokinase [Thermodesulfobacteriota bacterium]